MAHINSCSTNLQRSTREPLEIGRAGEHAEHENHWNQLTQVHLHRWPLNASSSLTTILLLLHPFNGLLSRTTWVSWHQKGKLVSILLEQEMIGWQWHQLDHMQIICTLLQTDNHASTSPLSFYRPDVLPATQPTASNCIICRKCKR